MCTPMVFSRGMTDELRERHRQASRLKIEGTGWDVGYAIFFLASDEARFITGAVLVVDGAAPLTTPSRG